MNKIVALPGLYVLEFQYPGGERYVLRHDEVSDLLRHGIPVIVTKFSKKRLFVRCDDGARAVIMAISGKFQKMKEG